MSTLPDVLLYCVQQDGYSIGTTFVYQYGEIYEVVEASRDGERWVVMAEDRYPAYLPKGSTYGTGLLSYITLFNPKGQNSFSIKKYPKIPGVNQFL